MTELPTIGPPLGLQSTSDDMSPEQRCSIGIQNIELLCDLDWRGRLMLGAELSRMKWSGDFTRDKDFWRPDETARGWPEWLKRRKFTLEGGEKIVHHETANLLIMWSVLYANFAAENEKRIQRGSFALPLPTSVSQLRPYQSMMQRVDDWVPPQLDRSHPSNHAGAFDLQPPFAEHQPQVIAAWLEAFESIPPDKRQRKDKQGLMVNRPPTETESRDYFRQKEGLRQLKEREEREIEQAKQDALTVGSTPANAERQAAAAAPPSATKKKAPRKKTQAELEAERRAFQVQQDVRDYRLKLNNLQQSAESLEGFIKNTLAREGSESYLRELRRQEMGVYSVADDVAKLRDAVVVCQSIYGLITEPYSKPEPISRHEVDPQTATVEV
tara:strand:+ start:1697 stop:2848 length:1152 start_codon:yes stop_codon:yes gene_type:complete